jgi:PAS domain S-box-containing protein
MSPVQSSPRRELLPRARRHNEGLPDQLPGDLAELVSHADAALTLRDVEITNASPGVAALLGWDPHLCIGRTMREVFDDAWSAVRELQDDAAAAVGHVAIQSDVHMLHVDGQDVWVDVMVADRPEAKVQLVLLTDVTARHEAAARQAHPANLDLLSGLPNRAYYLKAAEQAIAEADAMGRGTATLIVHVEAGTDTNDVMRVVGQRLIEEIRTDDELARVAEVEFAMLVRNVDPNELRAVIDDVSGRVLDALAKPFDGFPHGVPVRVGFSSHLPTGFRAAHLLDTATRRTVTEPITRD